jgi:colicin import membrane protein
MADEQQVNAGGVQTPGAQPGNGTAVTPQPGAQQPSVTPAQPPAQATTDDNFRKYQAERDRERARLLAQADEARAEAAKARAEAAEAAQQARRAQLNGLDPEEKAAALERELASVQQRQQLAEAQQVEQQRNAQKAMAALARAGISPDDARLAPYLAGENWTEKMANLAEGIAAIQGEELDKLRVEVTKAEKRGAQEALNAAGVTQTSGAASTPGDSMSAKEAEYRKRIKALRRSGNLAQVISLQTQAEREGISL